MTLPFNEWIKREDYGDVEQLKRAYQEGLDCHENALAELNEARAELALFADNDSSRLTAHILRNWDRGKIERFARYLLGDEAQTAGKADGIGMSLTRLRILYQSGEVNIYLPTGFEQLCSWAKSLSPDDIIREAIKTGSLFYKDFESTGLIYYSEIEPRIIVRYWENDEAPMLEKAIIERVTGGQSR